MTRLCLFLVLVSAVLAGRMVPELEEILATARPDEMIPVIVHLKEKADLSVLDGATREQKVEYLKTWADRTQASLLEFLRTTTATDIKPFWLSNCIALKARPDEIHTIVARGDVEYVTDDFVVMLVDFGSASPAVEDATDDQEWNLDMVRAPECWAEGYTGEGVVVGTVDTGLDDTYGLCVGFYDAVNGESYSYDDNGHGTHVAGIIADYWWACGVAPGARVMAAKALDRWGEGRASWIHACFNWYAGLGNNAPRVINNSWTTYRTILEYWADCLNLRALGIISVFAIGNEWSSPAPPSSDCAPGNYPTVIGVGATDQYDNVAFFSCRGPAPNEPPWNQPQYWGRPDWNLTKPDISAPGDEILSCRSNFFGYRRMSGTSQAAPHVTGCIALMLDKNPNLTYQQVYDILLDNADRPSQGDPYPNSNYGWGRLNCAAALSAVPLLETDARTVRVPLRQWVISGVPVTVQAIVQNCGSVPQLGFPVKLQITDSTGAVVYEDLDESSGSLASREQDTVVFSPDWSPPVPAGRQDRYRISVWTELTGDMRTANDTHIVSLRVVREPFIPPYLEKFYGWGPLGDNPLPGWRIIAGGTEPVPTWNTNDWHKSGSKARIYSDPDYLDFEQTRDTLMTPLLDCSGTGPYGIAYDNNFQDEDGVDEDTAFVLLSADGGSSWVVLGSQKDCAVDSRTGYDITSLAAGHADVRIAFVAHFGERGRTMWRIDDFAFSTQREWFGTELDSIPLGPKKRRVKAGGALAVARNRFIYALKGNNTNEFYVYDIRNNKWTFADSVPCPAEKNVKAGAALACDGERYVYLLKGNKTKEFWRFDTERGDTIWKRLPDVPGEKGIKAGSGLAYLRSKGTERVYCLKGKTREWYAFDCKTGHWLTDLESAPGGARGKAFKRGSCLAAGQDAVFALKGMSRNHDRQTEFYCYLPHTGKWVILDSLPATIPVSGSYPKDGAALACDQENNRVYALYGGGSSLFRYYHYASDSANVWGAWDTARKASSAAGLHYIKQGGAAACADGILYVLKGNNTLKFWAVTPGLNIEELAAPPPWLPGSGSQSAKTAASVVSAVNGNLVFGEDLRTSGPIRLTLVDVVGRRLKTAEVNQQEVARTGAAMLDLKGMAPGVYILRLEADGVCRSRKLVVVR
ncbi:MAG: S8 family serine peptidase [candidate division WOR-3 bacterium]